MAYMVEYRNKILIFILLAALFFFCRLSLSRGTNFDAGTKLLNPGLADKYYIINNAHPNWFTSPATYSQVRQRFIEVLDNAAYLGLNKEKYHYSSIKGSLADNDTTSTSNNHRILLDGLISYSKDLYEGADIANMLSNDEVSGKYVTFDDNYILDKLVTIASLNDFNTTLASFEPADVEYLQLKTELKAQLDSANTKKAEHIATSLDFYRWIWHFHFDRYVVVNIPTATLRYYEGQRPKLQMRVITGKPSTPTPCFSAYCDAVILYPYWNVPHTIAVKELIPKFKKNPGAIDKLNMEVITKSGEPVDHSSINWSSFDTSDFPFIFRQYTGCENSLGVLKFNLTDPFDVYMHDTNEKRLFAKSSRYFSHGCIRLEKPFELGAYLTDNTIDTSFLRSCSVGEKPVTNKLKKPVPVFVVYMPATVDEADRVILHKDIYHLF
jgi:L,D-transpeptidase YcbB